MGAIDIHFHIVPFPLLEALRAGELRAAVEVETQRDRDALTFHAPPDIVVEPGTSVRPHQYDERMLLAALDARRLDAAAVSPPPELLLYWASPEIGERIARIMNDGMAQLACAHRDRFLPLAMLPMQDPPRAVREAERAITDLGLRGIVLCTHVGGRDLDNKRYEPVFAAAARLEVPVFLHPQNAGDISRIAAYSDSCRDALAIAASSNVYTQSCPPWLSWVANGTVQGQSTAGRGRKSGSRWHPRKPCLASLP
jgi:aminocarboxymuconate-semialdehyde decarboxylase